MSLDIRSCAPGWEGVSSPCGYWSQQLLLVRRSRRMWPSSHSSLPASQRESQERIAPGGPGKHTCDLERIRDMLIRPCVAHMSLLQSPLASASATVATTVIKPLAAGVSSTQFPHYLSTYKTQPCQNSEIYTDTIVSYSLDRICIIYLTKYLNYTFS